MICPRRHGPMSTGRKDYPDDTWVRDVCKRGQGAACCRYLVIAPGGWSCAKHSALRELIDERFLAGTMTAQRNIFCANPGCRAGFNVAPLAQGRHRKGKS
jgi:hypothetical protein